ncbi:DNA repair protein RecO, partial [Candidatus Woesebacteria bacterium RBG_13_34_9]
MKPRKYAAEGIILARKNYKEADRILVVYTKGFGKLYLLAKGVRRPKSRKRGHVEVFSHIRFSSSKTKGMDIVNEVETINSFGIVRKNLTKVAVAYFIMEVIGRLMPENEKNEEIFYLVIDYLNRLKYEAKLRIFRKEFVYDILVNLGYWPKGKHMP